MADLRIVDAPVLLQESITDDVKMPTGGLGNFSIRLGDIVWYVVTKEQLANKNYVDLSSKGVKDSLDAHIADKANPHQVTKTQVGLGNVDNTADVDKPVSNATKSAIITATTDMATKAYVNSKDGDLTTLTTTDKTNLVKAINEVYKRYEGVGDLYEKNVEAGAGANGWTDLVIAAQGGLTQRQINNGLNSIAELLAIQNPSNGMRVYVKSYHAGKGKGGGTFVYDASKSAINDLGTVINGWVRQDIKTLTVWDFGYKVGDEAASTAAITACFTSSYPTALLAETLDSHKEILSITISSNKTIIGKGKHLSLLRGIVLDCRDASFAMQGFKTFDTKLNYALTFRDYEQVYVNDFEGENCYDAVMCRHAKNEKSFALIENSNAIKANRVGFTVDIDGKNVTYKNCTAYDSLQGFHLEGVEDITLENCTTVRCGQSAPVMRSDQPIEYGGGFRFFVYKNVTMINCKNLDRALPASDQLGSAGKTSTNLTMENCENINFEAENVATDVYENVYIKDSKNVGVYFWEVKAQFAGDLIIDNCTDVKLIAYGDNSTNLRYASFTNTVFTSISLKTNYNDATLVMDNVTVKNGAWNVFDGFKNVHCGALMSYFTDDATGIYPNYGYAFRGNSLKNLSIGTFSAIGKNGGYQLAFTDVDPLVLKQITIGSIHGEELFGINNPQNIPIKINSKMGAAVANATGTDDTANKLNALLTSLRNAKVIAP